MHTIFTLGERLNLTTYDATYLELAQREKIPLISLDQDLIKAAHKIGLKTTI
jgi:predicted nucleic acid-binding protein